MNDQILKNYYDWTVNQQRQYGFINPYLVPAADEVVDDLPIGGCMYNDDCNCKCKGGMFKSKKNQYKKIAQQLEQDIMNKLNQLYNRDAEQEFLKELELAKQNNSGKEYIEALEQLYPKIYNQWKDEQQQRPEDYSSSLSDESEDYGGALTNRQKELLNIHNVINPKKKQPILGSEQFAEYSTPISASILARQKTDPSFVSNYESYNVKRQQKEDLYNQMDQLKGGSTKEPYCGIEKKPPKGMKLGSMSECAQKGQIRRFGLNKTDPLTIQAAKTPKVNKNKLLSQIGSTKGKMNRLKKDIPYERNEDKQREMKQEFNKLNKQLKELVSTFNTSFQQNQTKSKSQNKKKDKVIIEAERIIKEGKQIKKVKDDLNIKKQLKKINKK